MAKGDWSEKERARSLARKQRRQSVNAASTLEVRVENDEYEREQQRLAKQRKLPYLRVLCSSKTRSHSRTLST